MSSEADISAIKVNISEAEGIVEQKPSTRDPIPAPVSIEDQTFKSTPTALESAPVTTEVSKSTITEPYTTDNSAAAGFTREKIHEPALKLEPVKEAGAEATASLESTREADVEKAHSTSQPSVSFDKDTKIHDGSPLSKFFSELPTIFEAAGHNEMWGITLDPSETHVQTSIVLEKFLRANTKDVSKAKAQLIEALKWRKTMQPQKLLEDTKFDKVKFGNLGYVTSYSTSEGHKEVVTWNIYGAVKDVKQTFSDVPE